MSVIARILLVWLAGYLFASGRINEEIRDILTTDPDAAALAQAALSGLFTLLWWGWWRLAKRMKWHT
jgi:hypothetical protein